MTMIYRFDSEIPPVTPLRLKVEVNTREHFTVFGFGRKRFAVDSPWFQGSTELLTYDVEELLATKLRALYQRRKVRDLYDLSAAVERLPQLDFVKAVECFERYLGQEGHRVSRAEFEANMAGKMRDPVFHGDLDPLLVPYGFGSYGLGPFGGWQPVEAYRRVHDAFISRLHGDAWKGA